MVMFCFSSPHRNRIRGTSSHFHSSSAHATPHTCILPLCLLPCLPFASHTPHIFASPLPTILPSPLPYPFLPFIFFAFCFDTFLSFSFLFHNHLCVSSRLPPHYATILLFLSYYDVSSFFSLISHHAHLICAFALLITFHNLLPPLFSAPLSACLPCTFLVIQVTRFGWGHGSNLGFSLPLTLHWLDGQTDTGGRTGRWRGRGGLVSLIKAFFCIHYHVNICLIPCCLPAIYVSYGMLSRAYARAYGHGAWFFFTHALLN